MPPKKQKMPPKKQKMQQTQIKLTEMKGVTVKISQDDGKPEYGISQQEKIYCEELNDMTEFPVSFDVFFIHTNITDVVMDYITKKYAPVSQSYLTEQRITSYAHSIYKYFYTKPHRRWVAPIKYVCANDDCEEAVKQRILEVPQQYKHLCENQDKEAQLIENLNNNISQINKKDENISENKNIYSINKKAINEKIRILKGLKSFMSTNHGDKSTEFQESNFPVSFDTFKQFTFYNDIIDNIYQSIAQTDEALSVLNNLEEQFLDPNNLLLSYYKAFYLQPEIRKIFPLKVKPCPKHIKAKLLQFPDIPLADKVNITMRKPLHKITKLGNQKEDNDKKFSLALRVETADNTLGKSQLHQQIQNEPKNIEKQDYIEKTEVKSASDEKIQALKRLKSFLVPSHDDNDIDLLNHNLPVSLAIFMKYTLYNEVIDKIYQDWVHSKNSLLILEPLEEKFFNRNNLLQSYYKAFYLQPNIRKLYNLRIKPCPAHLKAKLLALPKKILNVDLDNEVPTLTNEINKGVADKINVSAKKSLNKRTILAKNESQNTEKCSLAQQIKDNAVIKSKPLELICSKSMPLTTIKTTESSAPVHLRKEDIPKYNKQTSPKVLPDENQNEATLDSSIRQTTHNAKAIVMQNKYIYPVSFNTFVKYAHYKEVISNIIYDACGKPENFNEQNLQHQSLLYKLYISYYTQKHLRKKYPLRFKPCPLHMRAKLEEVAVLKNKQKKQQVRSKYDDSKFSLKFQEFLKGTNILDLLKQQCSSTDDDLVNLAFQYYIKFVSNPEIRNNDDVLKNLMIQSDQKLINKFFALFNPKKEMEAMEDVQQNEDIKNTATSPGRKEIIREINKTIKKPSPQKNNLTIQRRQIPKPNKPVIKKKAPMPVSLDEFKKFTHYNEVVEQILKENARGNDEIFLNLRKNKNEWKKALLSYYVNFYYKPSIRNKYTLRLKEVPQNIKDKILAVPAKTTSVKKTQNFHQKRLKGGREQPRRTYIDRDKSLSDDFLQMYISKKVSDAHKHPEILQRVKEKVDSVHKNQSNKAQDTTNALVKRSSATPHVYEQVEILQCEKEKIVVPEKPNKVQIVSVEIIKPANKNQSNTHYEREEIFNKLFEPIPLNCTLSYLLRFYTGPKQSVIRTVMNISFEDFCNFTNIYQLKNIYNDKVKLFKIYNDTIVNKQIWPLNLFIRISDIFAFLLQKHVKFNSNDLDHISPKFLHWTDLAENTDFDEIVRCDYFKNKGEHIENDEQLNMWRRSFYNRCWHFDDWIWEIPKIIDKNLIHKIDTTKNLDYVMKTLTSDKDATSSDLEGTLLNVTCIPLGDFLKENKKKHEQNERQRVNQVSAELVETGQSINATNPILTTENKINEISLTPNTLNAVQLQNIEDAFITSEHITTNTDHMLTTILNTSTSPDFFDMLNTPEEIALLSPEVILHKKALSNISNASNMSNTDMIETIKEEPVRLNNLIFILSDDSNQISCQPIEETTINLLDNSDELPPELQDFKNMNKFSTF